MFNATSRAEARQIAKWLNGKVVDARKFNEERPILKLKGVSDKMVKPKTNLSNWLVAVNDNDKLLVGLMN